MSDEFNLNDLLASLGEGMREPLKALTGGLADLARTPEVALVRHALRAVQAAGSAAGVASSPEVAAAVEQLRALADRLRREGIDPALGLANLLGDCLDGLDVLVATDAVPAPVELRELRAALARLRRPEVRLALTLPTERARAPLAGRLVRALVEDAELVGESPAALNELERAVAEAVLGAIQRTQAHDPARPVEVRARLRGDLLSLEIADWSGGEAPAEAEWDLPLVRRVMHQMGYEPGGARGTLKLTRRLRWWG